MIKFVKDHINSKLQDIEYQEYYILKDNLIYKAVIVLNENEIIIKINKYKIIIDLNNLSIFFQNNIDTIYKAYNIILNLFEENRVEIDNIINKKEIKLIFKKFCDNKNEIEIILSYDENNKNNIITEINRLNNEINNLKIQNNKLKKEIDTLKSYHTNPKNIKLLTDIKKDSYACTNLDNIFTVFKSINDILYLIYSNKSNSIICYDIIKRSIISEIKNCHNKNISNLRHYLDKANKNDLIMSISFRDNNIKLWKVKNWECILNLQNVNSNGYLDSACFLCENNQNYIIASNLYWGGGSEQIKVFDFFGNKIKEINNSNDKTYFIDSFYDKINNKNYIVTGNENYVKSYDFVKNVLYYKYYDNDNRGHFSIIEYYHENIMKLIESCFDGHIRIWNFHYGLLLNKIKVSNSALFGIALLNNNHLLVGGEDNMIKLIDLKNGTLMQSLNNHNKWVISIKKISHPKYGEFIISQGYDDDQIKIWVNN